MIENDDAPQATLMASPRSHRRLIRALGLSAGMVCLLIFLIPGSWRGSASDLHFAFDLRVLQPEEEIPQVAEQIVEPVVEAEPVEKPIWKNVEKDQMGRTVLRSGDCYRVLDDPGVANRWVQENFTQYIVFCGSGKSLPKELPFVADVVARYAYLQPDDGPLNTDVFSSRHW